MDSTEKNADIQKVAEKYWAPGNKGSHEKFDRKLIDKLYEDAINPIKFDSQKVKQLEKYRYFEEYLWPNYSSETSSRHYEMSIVAMLNEKKRQKRSDAWTCFKQFPDHFAAFFSRFISHWLDNERTLAEDSESLTFFVHSFCSGEERVQLEISKLGGMGDFSGFMEMRRENVKEETIVSDFKPSFFYCLSGKLEKQLTLYETFDEKENKKNNKEQSELFEKFMNSWIDLEAIILARKFLSSTWNCQSRNNVVMYISDTHLLKEMIRCSKSKRIAATSVTDSGEKANDSLVVSTQLQSIFCRYFNKNLQTVEVSSVMFDQLKGSSSLMGFVYTFYEKKFARLISRRVPCSESSNAISLSFVNAPLAPQQQRIQRNQELEPNIRRNGNDSSSGDDVSIRSNDSDLNLVVFFITIRFEELPFNGEFYDVTTLPGATLQESIEGVIDEGRMGLIRTGTLTHENVQIQLDSIVDQFDGSEIMCRCDIVEGREWVRRNLAMLMAQNHFD